MQSTKTVHGAGSSACEQDALQLATSIDATHDHPFELRINENS